MRFPLLRRRPARERPQEARDPESADARPPSTPPDEAPRSEPPPTFLSEVLAAFTESAFRASEAVRTQHLNDVEHFYDAPAPDDPDGAFVPKAVKLGVTPFVLPADGSQPPPLEVPLAALVQPDPLVIDELSFEFDCRVVGVEAHAVATGELPEAPLLKVGFDASQGSRLKVTLRLRAGQEPQASLRIGEALLRGVN